jgi:uncharacterized protein HemX
MPGIGDLLSIALAAISIATLAGLGFVRGRMTDLREQLRDSREETASLKASRADDRALIDQQKTELKACRTDLDALARVVTGEVHWVALSHHLDQHHEEARAHWIRSESNTERMIKALEELKGGRPQ